VEIILKIGADPTRWLTEGTDFGSVAAELNQSGPVMVSVAGPLRGWLVLSMPRAGTIALVPPMPGEGSHPSDPPPPVQPHALLSLRGPGLYLPSATGVTQNSAGYGLPADTDLAALEQAISTAMTDGTVLSVPLASTPGSPGGGLVMLDGATVAFAVICLPAAQG
jgi:hypothetical protein